MKGKRTLPLALVLLASIGCSVPGDLQRDKKSSKVGPQNGALVIVGGEATTPILQRFIDLAGGRNAPIVFIPTAQGEQPQGF